MAQQVKNLLAMQGTQERQPTQVFLPPKSHGQWVESGVLQSKGGKELDTTEQLSIYIYKNNFILNNIFSF